MENTDRCIILRPEVFNELNQIRKTLKTHGMSATHSDIVACCIKLAKSEAGGIFGICCDLAED